MSEWISVDDRLPDDCEPVIALDIGVFTFGVQIICTFDKGEFCQDTTVAEVYGGEPLGKLNEFEVSYWMSLPEPPQ